MNLKKLMSNWESDGVRIAFREDMHRVLSVVSRKTPDGERYDCLCFLRTGGRGADSWDVSCDLQGVEGDLAIKWALEGRRAADDLAESRMALRREMPS